MINLTMKTVSSLEKCFWDETLDTKVEKKEFYMFKNEKLSFQVAYYSDVIFNKLFDVKLGGTFAKYADVKQVVSVPAAYPVRNDTKCNLDCLRNTPGLYPDLIRPLHYEGKVRVI